MSDLEVPENQPVPLAPHERLEDYTPIYHWSPAVNHNRILDNGLKIRQPALQGNWRPPFISFATTPMLAWALSAMRSELNDVPYDDWDLWCVWTRDLNWVETIHFDDGDVRELRVYRNISPKKLWFVGRRNINE